MLTAPALAAIYQRAHDTMRNLDGLQPQEAFDELLKVLLFEQRDEAKPAQRAPGARALRARFTRYLADSPPSARELWSDRRLRLSDAALTAVHALFAEVSLAAVSFDVRSAALRLFLGAELRRGLGIFPTPDEIARAVVAAVAPEPGTVVYDPACGSGTFLVEVLRVFREREDHHGHALRVRGSDINARMLLLAELNLGHAEGVAFEGRIFDAIAPDNERDGPEEGSVEVILTNPPFGVYLPRPKRRARRAQGEVVFLLRCLRWLRPGGKLAIVVPRGLLTNNSLAEARRAIDHLAELTGVIHLPPEAFAATGTQTNTSVLFLRRRAEGDPRGGDMVVPVIDVTNVGWDLTGRERPGSQLAQAGADLHASMREGRAVGLSRGARVPRATPLASLSSLRAQAARRLGDVVALAETGRTPRRSAYAERGAFALKVGNLTGRGIDWTARDRNFVDAAAVPRGLWLEAGDIVLTATAHHPKYIAQKIDIVGEIPAFAGGRATFVGELIRLRVKEGTLSPFELCAHLRSPATQAAIRALVRGQTAHLRPQDLLELPLPEEPPPARLAELLRREVEIAGELNRVAAEERELLGILGIEAADSE